MFSLKLLLILLYLTNHKIGDILYDSMVAKTLKKINPKNLYRSHILRVGIFASLSSATAYTIAVFLPWVDAPVAAIIGLAALKPTFHATLRESFQQIMGTVIGAVFGLALVGLLGFNVFTLIIMITISFLVAWWLKLGEVGAITIGLTLILVTGPLSNLASIEARLFGVILGSLTAIIASYFILPGTPQERTMDASLRISNEASAILKVMATRLGERDNKISLDETKEWKKLLEVLIAELMDLRKDAEDAVEGSRWSPLIQKKEALEALQYVENTEQTTLTVYNICNDMSSAIQQKNLLPDTVAINISQMLLTAATGIKKPTKKKKRKVVVDTGEVPVDVSEEFNAKKDKAIDSIKNVDDTQAITLGGSLIQDATKLKKNSRK